MASTRLHELLDRWHEGEASPAERAELEESLRADRASRRALVRFMLLEVHLHGANKVATGQQMAVAPAAPRPRRGALDRIAAAAVIGLTLLAVTVFLARPRSHELVSGRIQVDGTLTSKLSDGQWMDVLGSEPAVLRLRSGVRIELDPGSRGVPGDGFFELASGGGQFEAGKEKFQVRTPKGVVSTTGARFSVELMPLPVTTLAIGVATGAVQVEYEGRHHQVRSGESRLFPRPADVGKYGKMLADATLTLAEAIRKAQSIQPRGVVIGAELEDEDGKTVYSIELAVGDRTLELDLNPVTGEEIGREEEDDDNSPAAGATRIPLVQAIEIALGRVPGRAVTAEVELEKTRAEFEIKVFAGGRITEVKIDASTGEITRVKEEKKKDREKSP